MFTEKTKFQGYLQTEEENLKRKAKPARESYSMHGVMPACGAILTCGTKPLCKVVSKCQVDLQPHLKNLKWKAVFQLCVENSKHEVIHQTNIKNLKRKTKPNKENSKCEVISQLHIENSNMRLFISPE